MRLIRPVKDAGREPHARLEDPVLAMLGVGQQLWEHEAGNRFIERLRSEDISIHQVRGRCRHRLFVTNDTRLSGLVVPGITFITGIGRTPY